MSGGAGTVCFFLLATRAAGYRASTKSELERTCYRQDCLCTVEADDRRRSAVNSRVQDVLIPVRESQEPESDAAVNVPDFCLPTSSCQLSTGL